MSNDINVKIFSNIEEISTIRGIWEKMQYHPNSDIDFFLTILKSNKEYVGPFIMIIYLNGSPRSMLIGRLEERKVGIKIAYKTLCKPKLRMLSIIYSGILGDQSQYIAKIILHELKRKLLHNEVDAVYLSSARVDSHLYKMSKSLPFMYRDHFPKSNIHWNMKMGVSVNEILQKIKSKHRTWMRTRIKKLEEDYPGQVAFRSFLTITDVKLLGADAERIAKHTYQRGLGSGFILDDVNLKRLELMAEKGWLRGYILYVANKPCAYWIGTLYKNTFHLDSTGYDPNYRKYELGTILFLKMLEDLCAHQNVKEIDFGFGDAFYKERFGDVSWEETSLFIYAPTFRGIKFKVLRTSTDFVSFVAEKIVKKLELREKIKKFWRRKIESSASVQKVSN